MKIPPPPPPARTLGLYATPEAGAYYRLIVPLRATGGTWASYEGVTPEQLEVADTVVLCRCGGPIATVRHILDALRGRWGVRQVLLDYDDAYFAHVPVVEVQPKDEHLEGVAYALAMADGVIVQNQALREHFTPYTRAPIHVVPNLIDVADWPAEAPPADDPPVVLLAGSPSHALDWQQVMPALRWLREKCPDVVLRVVGCPLPEAKALATEWRDSVDIDRYPALMAGVAIALCPLPDSEFNRGKSPVKAYEYALGSGAAIIGSPTQYAPVLAERRGFVVPDGDAAGWAKCLAWLLAHPAERRAMGARLRAWVMETRDVRRYAAELQAVYAEEETCDATQRA